MPNTNKKLVILDKATNKYFAGFKSDYTTKWTPDVFKARRYSYNSNDPALDFEIKIDMKILKNTVDTIENRVFEYSVSDGPLNEMSLGLEKIMDKKAVDLDSI